MDDEKSVDLFESNIDSDSDVLDNEDEESEEGVQIRRYAFNSFRIERSIRDLLGWERAGKLRVPDFQRSYVWKYAQASRFIDSLLLGLPVPDMFMFRDVDIQSSRETFLLIDGLQRFTTIRQFVAGEYFGPEGAKRKFKIGVKSSAWYGKSFNELDQSDQDFLYDYSFKINIFDSNSAKPEEKNLYMTEIFNRINSSATPLSKQNIRNAIYNGPITDELKSVSENAEFKIFISNNQNFSTGCRDQEFILRTLVYYRVTKNLADGSPADARNGSVSPYQDELMGRYMEDVNKKRIDCEEDADRFLKAIKVLNDSKSILPKAFQRGSNELSSKIHPVTAESVIIALMMGCTLPENDENLMAFKQSLRETGDTGRSPFYSSTRDPKNVLERFLRLQQVMR